MIDSNDPLYQLGNMQFRPQHHQMVDTSMLSGSDGRSMAYEEEKKGEEPPQRDQVVRFERNYRLDSEARSEIFDAAKKTFKLAATGATINLCQLHHLLIAVTEPLLFSDGTTQPHTEERVQRALLSEVANSVKAVNFADLANGVPRTHKPPSCAWDRVIAVLGTQNDLSYYSFASELYCGSKGMMSDDENPTVLLLSDLLQDQSESPATLEFPPGRISKAAVQFLRMLLQGSEVAPVAAHMFLYDPQLNGSESKRRDSDHMLALVMDVPSHTKEDVQLHLRSLIRSHPSYCDSICSLHFMEYRLPLLVTCWMEQPVEVAAKGCHHRQ